MQVLQQKQQLIQKCSEQQQMMEKQELTIEQQQRDIDRHEASLRTLTAEMEADERSLCRARPTREALTATTPETNADGTTALHAPAPRPESHTAECPPAGAGSACEVVAGEYASRARAALLLPPPRADLRLRARWAACQQQRADEAERAVLAERIADREREYEQLVLNAKLKVTPWVSRP